MVLKPAREHATNNAQTYFVTSKTWESCALFHAEPWARLFFQNLLAYRDSYLLHEFVLMPDHFHLLMTPRITLERSLQFIKGGFSFRVKKELGSNMEVWQRGFSDHRIRDFEDYEKHRQYIHLNPVKKHLCASPAEYRYSSAFPGWKLDSIPQGLKPLDFLESDCGTAEAVPFQSNKKATPKPDGLGSFNALAEACTLQSAEAAFFQSNRNIGSSNCGSNVNGNKNSVNLI
jgi:putative transposase